MAILGVFSSEMDKAFEIMKNKDCGKVVLTLKEE